MQTWRWHATHAGIVLIVLITVRLQNLPQVLIWCIACCNDYKDKPLQSQCLQEASYTCLEASDVTMQKFQEVLAIERLLPSTKMCWKATCWSATAPWVLLLGMNSRAASGYLHKLLLWLGVALNVLSVLSSQRRHDSLQRKRSISDSSVCAPGMSLVSSSSVACKDCPWLMDHHEATSQLFNCWYSAMFVSASLQELPCQLSAELRIYKSCCTYFCRYSNSSPNFS